MRLRSEQVLSLCLWLGVVAFCVWARQRLPDAPVATHFGLNGQADGYMPRDVALAFGPGLMLVFGFLLWALPALSSKEASLKRSQSVFDAAQLAIIAFLAVVHIVVVLKALGVPLDIVSILSLGTGFLFLIIGNFLPKTRFNYVMGIRTPWTLSDERVWDKTHRLAGPLFMLAGLMIILAACLLPRSWQINVVLTSTLGAALIACIYAYMAARRLR